MKKQLKNPKRTIVLSLILIFLCTLTTIFSLKDVLLPSFEAYSISGEISRIESAAETDHLGWTNARTAGVNDLKKEKDACFKNAFVKETMDALSVNGFTQIIRVFLIFGVGFITVCLIYLACISLKFLPKAISQICYQVPKNKNVCRSL